MKTPRKIAKRGRRGSLGMAFLLASLLACSSGDSSSVIDAGANDADTTGPGESFTVKWGPVDVEAGVENTMCVITRLNNDRSVHIGKIHNFLGNVSHHFIIYRITSGEETSVPFECQPFANTLNPENGAPLMVTQRSEETLTLPEGVGFTFEPNQLVRLELHYVNATSDKQTVEVTSTFTTVADADFQYEADFLFIGNPDITLPPGQSVTVGPKYLPLPADLEGAKIFGITGHTHALGTQVKVAYQEGASGASTMLYDLPNFSWEEPETIRLDPPTVVGAGGGFNFSCSWTNTTGAEVKFGESATQEMCFFWAYYYPSKGAKVCVHSDQRPEVATDLCCPGDPLCALLGGLL